MRVFLAKLIPILMIGILISCSSGGDGDTNTSNPTTNPGGNSGTPTSTPPGSFALTFPNNNEICQEGAAVANDPQSLLINFNWAASSNADNYELTLIESESGNEVAKVQTASTNLDIEISKGILYQWSVKATNSDGEFTSTQWSFYSKGEIIGNYVPYPAYNINLTFDKTNDLLSIQWEASDEDDDSLSFDVLFFEDGIEVLNVTDITNNAIADLTVVLGFSYYVTITVKDGTSAVTTSSKEMVYE